MSAPKKPAARRNPKDFRPPGIRLDYSPFDAADLETIVAEVRLPTISSDPARTAEWLEQVNLCAIWLKYNRELARLPLPSAELKLLNSIARQAAKLSDLLPLRVLDDDFESAESQDLSAAHDSPEPDDRIVHVDEYEPSPREAPVLPAEDEGVQVAPGVSRLLLDHIHSALETRRARQRAGTPEPVDWIDLGCAEDVLPLLATLIDLLADAAQTAVAEKEEDMDASRPHPERRFVEGLLPIYAEMFGREIGMSRGSEGNPQGPLLRFLKACFQTVGDPPKDETLVAWTYKLERSLPD